MRIAALAVVVALALLVAGHGTAPPAAAHAILLETVPADGATVDDPPSEVALRFNEDVRLGAEGIRVYSDAGERVDLDDAGQGQSRDWIRVSLRAGLDNGTYLVAWGVISADDHPIRGSFLFHIGEPSSLPAVDLPAASTPLWVDIFSSIVRWLTYGAALLAAGVAAFLLLVYQGPATERRRLVHVVAGIALVTLVMAPLGVIAESLNLALGDTSRALDGEHLRGVLDSGHGVTAALLAAGAMLLLFATLTPAESRPLWLLPGALVAVSAFAWRGHTATIDPPWLGISLSIAHNAAAAAWFGGLVALGLVVLTRGRRAEAPIAPLLARFGRMALIAFALLAIAGIALAISVLPSFSALVDTRYGVLLVAKLVLVTVALGLAVYHRFRAIPRVRADASHEPPPRRTIGAEGFVLAAVVLLTAVLVSQDPGAAERPTPPVASGPFISDAIVGDFHFDIRVDPARPGENTIEVDFHGIGDADPATIHGVRLQIVEDDRDIGPFARDMEEVAPGAYRYSGAEMNLPGDWQVTVAVRLTEFEEQRITFPVPIR